MVVANPRTGSQQTLPHPERALVRDLMEACHALRKTKVEDLSGGSPVAEVVCHTSSYGFWLRSGVGQGDKDGEGVPESADEFVTRVQALQAELKGAEEHHAALLLGKGDSALHSSPGTALIQRARRVFDGCDTDGDGRLSKKEAKAAISGDESLMVLFGFHNMRCFRGWFQAVDKDNDGSISSHELEEWLLRHHTDDARAEAMRMQQADDEAEALAERAQLASNVASLRAQLAVLEAQEEGAAADVGASTAAAQQREGLEVRLAALTTATAKQRLASKMRFVAYACAIGKESRVREGQQKPAEAGFATVVAVAAAARDGAAGLSQVPLSLVSHPDQHTPARPLPTAASTEAASASSSNSLKEEEEEGRQVASSAASSPASQQLHSGVGHDDKDGEGAPESADEFVTRVQALQAELKGAEEHHAALLLGKGGDSAAHSSPGTALRSTPISTRQPGHCKLLQVLKQLLQATPTA